MDGRPARYLLRWDDFCPTMLSDRRERFLSLMARHEIKPILAVVPDNHDSDLKLQAADPHFWDRMRACEAAGATIAMHGYRHLCVSRGRSILNLHPVSEFAGVNERQQHEWIRLGLQILRGHGLDPRLFIAPRHGFDHRTLRVLAEEGLSVVSDGFARRPFLRDGVLWIPQQLWEPVHQTSGLWTICVHSNTATSSLEKKLEKFLDAYGGQFTTFDEVIADDNREDLDWTERLAASLALGRVKTSSAKTRLFHGR